MLHKTMFSTPIIQPLLKCFSRVVLKCLGWKIQGDIPKTLQQCVVIGAPHTSNWDMPLSLMVAFSLDVPLYWVGKESIFKFPFAGIMRWMGGIPVDRSKSNNMVDATIQQFSQHAELRIMMSPEGTRSKVDKWKSGFYYIAHGAGVPVVLGFIDYKTKRAGVLGQIETTGDYEADLASILEIYQPYF